MITVNIWEGHSSFVIHAFGHTPETTVSWWPRDGGFDLCDDEGVMMPYATELRAEAGIRLLRRQLYTLTDANEGVPGAREHIGLDASAILDWWRLWQVGRYRLIDRNCCNTVVAGLIAGGATEYYRLAGFPDVDPAAAFTGPGYVDAFCRAVQLGMTRSRF